jgi:hypothetical protein
VAYELRTTRNEFIRQAIFRALDRFRDRPPTSVPEMRRRKPHQLR